MSPGSSPGPSSGRSAGTSAGTVRPTSAEVVSSRALGAYQQLAVTIAAVDPPPRAGQFVVALPGPGELEAMAATWWVGGAGTESGFGTTLELVLRSAGDPPRPGDRITLLGPLGRGFAAPTSAVPVLVVGHEAGEAPARWWARELRGRGCTTRLLLSAADPDLHVDLGQARRSADVVVLTTPQDLEQAVHRIGVTDDIAVLYAVGPGHVCAAVARVGRALGIPPRVTAFDAEADDQCGVGLCGVCERRLAAPGSHPVRPCVDGPVLRGDLVLWDAAR